MGIPGRNNVKWVAYAQEDKYLMLSYADAKNIDLLEIQSSIQSTEAGNRRR